MPEKMTEDKELVILGGTHSNKGGLAIVHGTFKVFNKLGINFKYIVDPDPSFPDEFFTSFGLIPIYRWSKSLGERRVSSLTLSNAFIPFIKCLKNSCNSQVRQLRGIPIWYIGDSSLNDYRSVLSLFGQIISLSSLKLATNGDLIVNASLGYMRTKVGEILLRYFLKSVNHFFVRGKSSYDALIRLGVPSGKISIVCDFAFHLDKATTKRSIKCAKPITESGKPAIAFIFKNPPLNRKINKFNYIKTIQKLASQLERRGYKIFFIPTSYAPIVIENDLVFLNEIGAEPILDIRKLTPEEIIDVFSNFEAVVTMRLHGAVFSTLAGVPTFHIYEAPNSLDVIRDTFGEFVPLCNISNFVGGDTKRIIEDIENLIQMKDEISHQIKACINTQRRRSIDELKFALDSFW